jgi:hypothetical protein
VIAVAAHALAGNRERAALWAANVRERARAVTAGAFFRSFPFADARTRQRIARALSTHDI